MDIKVCLDNKCFDAKPSGNEVAAINNRIAQNEFTLKNADWAKAFAKLVGEQGCTFSPSTFENGTRKQENFEQMQLLVLDFDGGITHKEVLDRAEKYDVPVFFSYNTFSSTEDNERFRVCFINDIPISDRRAAKIAKNMLRTIFHESDKCDSDISRMYYGGKKLISCDTSMPTVNLESLNRNMTIYLMDKYKGNYQRELVKFSRDNKVALKNNKLLDISVIENATEDNGVNQNDEKSPDTIIMYNKNPDGEFSSKISYRINLIDTGNSVVSDNKKADRNHKPYRTSMLGVLSDGCKLYSEFESGSRRLSHDELFGVATNVLQIETGTTRFMEILKNHSYYDDREYKYPKWEYDFKFIKKDNYNPQNCNIFCPYSDKCIHAKNILMTVKPKSHIRVEGYREEFVPLEEAVKDLNEYLEAAIDAGDNGIHVIKAQTSIGKTYSYIHQMVKSGERFLIAASTNILKNEIYERAKEAGADVIKTPSLHEIKEDMPDDIWENIEKLYRTGQYDMVHPYIKEVLEKEDIDCLREYMEERDKYFMSDKNVITTHKKLLYMDEDTLNRFDVIITDEDIVLKSFIPNHISVSVSKLEKLAKKSKDISVIKKIHTALKKIETETMFTLESFECNEDSAGMSADIDIPAFCNAEHFYYRNKWKENNLNEDQIVFINPVALSEYSKYIIVSATVDEKIYEYVFGDRVHFYECRKVKYTGCLNQYVGRSFSRASIDSDPGVLDRIVAKTGINNQITFKKYNRGELYMGNLEGSNIYEGEDLNVVATPYEAEFLYKLFPYSLGLPFDYDEEIGRHKVERNGYIFEMNTYEDDVLRDFQLWMIESQLEQAVGRSRLLRHDCTVNLFSVYPLSQANIIYNFDFD